MSWRSSAFAKRVPITIINTAGGATPDSNTVIPVDLDAFWSVIDTSANELRVTAADGYTLLNYSVDDGSGGAFSKSSRLGRIRIDGMAAPGVANEALLVWLYFGTDGTQGSAAVATTITSAETGVIERGAPRDSDGGDWVEVAAPPRPGLDRPRGVFGKGSADASDLWLEVSNLLQIRASRYAGKLLYEEPRSATYVVDDDAGSAQAGMIDLTLSRWVEVVTGTGQRKLFLRMRVKAGSSGSQYTAVPTIVTAIPLQSGTHRTLTARAGFRVRDVLET